MTCSADEELDLILFANSVRRDRLPANCDKA